MSFCMKILYVPRSPANLGHPVLGRRNRSQVQFQKPVNTSNSHFRSLLIVTPQSIPGFVPLILIVYLILSFNLLIKKCIKWTWGFSFHFITISYQFSIWIISTYILYGFRMHAHAYFTTSLTISNSAECISNVERKWFVSYYTTYIKFSDYAVGCA